MADEENKLEFEELNIDGMLYDTLLTEKFKNRKAYTPANHNLIKAFIPGTVIKVKVRRGKKVETGDELLVFDAMKMQNTITAPFDGKIKKINVKKGQMVPKNFVMIEME
jgi:biotin carboxyl carrier protein